MSVKHYASVCVSGTPIASFLHRTILSSVARPSLTYFATLPHKWHDFCEKVVQSTNVCSDLLYNFV